MRLLLVIFLALPVFIHPATAQAYPAPPSVSAPEAIVIDGWSGAVLYAKHADVPRNPASTVKIMTALVILQRHVPMRRWVTVSQTAVAYGGSTANLYVGERLTVWDLLHAMLLPSGNDAAVTLAEAVGGSATRFTAMMNAEAHRLHMWHTHYLSPNGFDMWGQVTTARDLATVTRRAMMQPAFAQIVRTRQWRAVSAQGTVHVWLNLNKLLWRSGWVDGVKTGTTPGAGACLVSSAEKSGRWIVAVNMGSLETTRFSDGAALLSYGFGADVAPPSTR